MHRGRGVAAALLVALALGAVRADESEPARRLAASVLDAAASASPGRSTQLLESCDEMFYETKLDPFLFADESTFPLRYFYCAEHYQPSGPIFFYPGGSADVTTYVNTTGLMWENAEQFGALLVFAEHRYFGASQPFDDATVAGAVARDEVEGLLERLAWLTTEHAMADHAGLLYAIKERLGDRYAPTIAFGGIYSGLQAAWLRAKYPHLVDGAIVSSAPVGAFAYGDALYAGSAQTALNVSLDDTFGDTSERYSCAANLAAAWAVVRKRAATPEGRAGLVEAFGLCAADSQLVGGRKRFASILEVWIQEAINSVLSGNFAAVDRLFGGRYLPSNKLEAVCEAMAAADATATGTNGTSLVEGLAQVVGIVYNATGTESCVDWFSILSDDRLRWFYLSCDSLFVHATQLTASPFASTVESCETSWGFVPDASRAYVSFGGYDFDSGVSDILFSSGELDPWRSSYVVTNLSDSLVALTIPGETVIADLTFSTPDDSQHLIDARQVEMRWVERWIAQRRAARPSPSGSAPAPSSG